MSKKHISMRHAHSVGVAVKDLERLKLIKLEKPFDRKERMLHVGVTTSKKHMKPLMDHIVFNLALSGCNVKDIDNCIKEGVAGFLNEKGIMNPKRVYHATELFTRSFKQTSWYNLLQFTCKKTLKEINK
jgi:hypothetical protein